MTKRKTLLTGITPSGTVHVGNYVGAIKPALEMAKNTRDFDSYFFIADYHSLVKLRDGKLRKQYIYEIAATWLALGLNPDNVNFYLQSDIPEIMELNWILSSVTAKGLLNRSHAYKAVVDMNVLKKNKDEDAGVMMGLFSYPVLMAADIVIFSADLVPVGKDQMQHLEIVRDIADRVNYIYKCDLLRAPKPVVDQDIQIIPGLDGKKMSKSYNNTIALFSSTSQLRKSVMKIITNSQLSDELKETKNCTIFSLYKHFADKNEIQALAEYYQSGISWSEAKQILFEKMDESLTPIREKYNDFLSNKKIIDVYLEEGARKARIRAKKFLGALKEKIGI